MSFSEAGRSSAWKRMDARVRRLAEGEPGAWPWDSCPGLSPWSESRPPWLPGHGVEGLGAEQVAPHGPGGHALSATVYNGGIRGDFTNVARTLAKDTGKHNYVRFNGSRAGSSCV